MKRLALSASLIALASAAAADAPRVMTDIAPVQSLVARVMGDLGSPGVLVAPGASPHGYALRPSEAKALSEAEIVVMIGERLTPWLMKPVESLGDKAHVITLLEVDGITRLEKRTGVTFERHDHAHGDDHDDHDDHKHDDHADKHDDDHKHDDHAQKHDDHAHKHDDDHKHDDHAHKHDDDHKHDDHADKHDDHAAIDSHAWLDPQNAALWLDVIADELAEHDPDNAATYRANAAAGQAELATLATEITASLQTGDRAFIVFHDAYQYFEQRFGLSAAGSISLSEATPPSAGRISELKSKIADLDIGCVFTEPQMNPGVINALDLPGSVRTVEIDPLGAALDSGASLYPALLRNMAASFATCVAK